MKKNKGYTKQYRNDDPTTHLTNEDQQKAMLLDTIDDAKQKTKKRVVEPIEIPEIISVPRRQPIMKTEIPVSYNTRPETVGLSQRFTQDKLREGKILKQLDQQLTNERKNSEKTNKGGDTDRPV